MAGRARRPRLRAVHRRDRLLRIRRQHRQARELQLRRAWVPATPATRDASSRVREIGVRAQIQHLRNFADPTSRASDAGATRRSSSGTAGAPTARSIPRSAIYNFDRFFAKGNAPTWNQMGGPGKWASAPTYGDVVIATYNRMLTFNGLPGTCPPDRLALGANQAARLSGVVAPRRSGGRPGVGGYYVLTGTGTVKAVGAPGLRRAVLRVRHRPRHRDDARRSGLRGPRRLRRRAPVRLRGDQPLRYAQCAVLRLRHRPVDHPHRRRCRVLRPRRIRRHPCPGDRAATRGSLSRTGPAGTSPGRSR